MAPSTRREFAIRLPLFGKRAGEYAARLRRKTRGTRHRNGSGTGVREALAPFDRPSNGCEGTLSDSVRAPGCHAGLRRHRSQRSGHASARWSVSRTCLANLTRRRVGPREYNPGWHTALDLRGHADRLRSRHACRPRSEGEPRRAVREDIRTSIPSTRAQHRREAEEAADHGAIAAPYRPAPHRARGPSSRR